ncbi:MAG: hypothetical protein ACKVOJ_12045 [Sphingomonadaceae bacterium]
MNIVSKTALVAAGVAVLVSATPALARDYDHRGGISAGDVIAGALVIGGIAAIASAASRGDRNHDNGYGYQDRGYERNRYDDDRGSRYAVEQCVYAAQRNASRYGRARVTDVTRIDRIGGGFEVRGRVIVEQRGYYGDRYRGNWDRYGYQYDSYNEGYDRGRFSCVTQYDRVADLRLSGLRG